LEASIQQASAKPYPLAPGFYAHLAWMYSQVGKQDLAIKALQAEKKQYPESSQLVDRLLQPILSSHPVTDQSAHNEAKNENK
jgi:hypothetical protein